VVVDFDGDGDVNDPSFVAFDGADEASCFAHVAVAVKDNVNDNVNDNVECRPLRRWLPDG
jgi:hypothetical protein